jgi:hypothetical protein
MIRTVEHDQLHRPRWQGTRAVHAYVNHSRWLWDCPVCNGSELCSDLDPRAVCRLCGNAGDGWWQIVWPDDTTRERVEVLLERRPDPRTRNWTPGELVEQLQAENLQHGIDPDLPGLIWPGGREALGIVQRLAVDAGTRRALAMEGTDGLVDA